MSNIRNSGTANKRFSICLHFVGWSCISFGAHICFTQPNIEVHLPFCFVRVGWTASNNPALFQFASPRQIVRKNAAVLAAWVERAQ